MDILKAATEWAKAEAFSSQFFVVAGALFAMTSFGFSRLGQTAVAKSFVVPTLVCALLLLVVGIGIFGVNKSRVSSFAHAYDQDPQAFVESEIVRTEKSMGEFKNIVFKVIPFLIALAALLIVFFQSPLLRASCVSAIAMLVVIIFVDSNANARLIAYHDNLLRVQQAEK